MKVELKEGDFNDSVGHFVLGGTISAAGSAIGSGVGGSIGGAVGSFVGGWAGSKVAKGGFQKGFILGMGILNAIDYVVDMIAGGRVAGTVRDAQSGRLGLMTVKPDSCQKCGRICIEKDNFLRGPLEGRYEWLCGSCYNIDGMVRTVKWKA